MFWTGRFRQRARISNRLCFWIFPTTSLRRCWVVFRKDDQIPHTKYQSSHLIFQHICFKVADVFFSFFFKCTTLLIFIKETFWKSAHEPLFAVSICLWLQWSRQTIVKQGQISIQNTCRLLPSKRSVFSLTGLNETTRVADKTFEFGF